MVNDKNINPFNTCTLDTLPKDIEPLVWSLLDAKDLFILASTNKTWFNSPALMQTLINKLKPKTTVQSVSTRQLSTFFLMQDGSVFGCGWNNYGHLGLGHTNNQLTPVQITSLGNRVKVVVAGLKHTIFIMKGGSVFGCGRNDKHQLGLGHTNDQLNPVQIPVPGKIKAVAAGDSHTIFLMENGTVFGCGWNNKGELGLDVNTYYPKTPVAIPIPGIVQTVAAGFDYTIFLMDDGGVFGCGNNDKGQLGLGHTNDQLNPVQIPVPGKVQAVAVGIYHTIFLMEDGTIFGCGGNFYNQLNPANTRCYYTPVTIPIPGGKAQTVAAGACHTIFLTPDGGVFGCGRNDDGQLGLGDTDYSAAPVPIPIPGGKAQAVFTSLEHTIFLVRDGSVFGCGKNDSGELGFSGHSRKQTTPVKLNIGDPKIIEAINKLAARQERILKYRQLMGMLVPSDTEFDLFEPESSAPAMPKKPS